MARRVLMGNEAIARGIVEAGCAVATAYPGTPASEIQEAVIAFTRESRSPLHAEWSVNEKVAYEVALGASYTGKRAAVSMKQVGLNVAADPFMRSSYLGVKGGFLVVSADDPGPHSSQTEQDSRFFAMFAKLPVLDPASPREAKALAKLAFAISEDYEIPVVLRPTTRVCHARQAVSIDPADEVPRTALFKKDPERWAATPDLLPGLHRRLAEKLNRIAGDPRLAPVHAIGDGTFRRACLIGSGVALAHAEDLLDETGLSQKLDIFRVTMPFPLPLGFADQVRAGYDRVLVIEETYPVIESQLGDPKVVGRHSGLVPCAGELTPDVIRGIILEFLGLASARAVSCPAHKRTRPTLCAGCGHRAAFLAIRETFPGGIFPSDIGCYTLGLNLHAVDTCHCMGASISQAAGLYHAYAPDGAAFPTIVATIGDSTFFHSGVPALVNAVIQKARFILVILDNGVSAMTGHQPTAGQARGEGAVPFVSLRSLVEGAGVGFVREVDPYDIAKCVTCLKEAERYSRGPVGGVSVIIASHPCLLQIPPAPDRKLRITEECTGCRACLSELDCPAIIEDEESGRASIDASSCKGCGVCVEVCPSAAIVRIGS